VRYAYDPSNRLTGITTPSGRSISYRYDALGRINQVSTTDATGSTQILANQMTYRPFGGDMKTLTYGNGLNLTRSFDAAAQLTAQKIQGAQAIQDLNLIYDATGNITDKANVLDPSRTQTFGYDALDRLIGAQGIYGNLGYSYDALGNRLSQTDATGTSTYLYEAQSHRLTSITDSGGRMINYSYDANGNPLIIGSDTYVYNPNNRMIQYQGTTTASYVYNSRGQRTRKTIGANSTRYIYDQQGRLLGEYGPNASKEYVYLDGQPLALIEDNNIYYIHNDHLATPQQLTDANQTIVWAADYKPFGEVTETINTIDNNIRFPGQYEDEETGLNYNYFRYYDAGIGRYMTSDPIGISGGINTYLYGNGNPIMNIDRDGLDSLSVPNEGKKRGPPNAAWCAENNPTWSTCIACCQTRAAQSIKWAYVINICKDQCSRRDPPYPDAPYLTMCPLGQSSS